MGHSVLQFYFLSLEKPTIKNLNKVLFNNIRSVYT